MCGTGEDLSFKERYTYGIKSSVDHPLFHRRHQQTIMGPRATRNQKRYLEQALKEKKKEEELKSIQKDTIQVYESTTAAAQKHAREQTIITTMNDESQILNEGNDSNHNDHHAITFWSHHLLSTRDSASNRNIGGKNTSFAKNTSFTNDVHDGRLQHASN